MLLYLFNSSSNDFKTRQSIDRADDGSLINATSADLAQASACGMTARQQQTACNAAQRRAVLDSSFSQQDPSGVGTRLQAARPAVNGEGGEHTD